jgi:sigma-B regulation protein RsbU (phosphoserine phosphatase)
MGEKGVESIQSGNLPVGMLESGAYCVHRFQLRPSETLVLYTDGLVESRNERGEEYGTAKLIRVLEKNRTRDPGSLLESVLQDLHRFRDGRRPEDDLSLLAVRRA